MRKAVFLLLFLVLLSSFASAVAVSNFEILELGGNGFVVGWNTDVPTTGQIHYGTSGSLGLTSSMQSTRSTQHQIQIDGLPSGTVYYFRGKGNDIDGNGYDSFIGITRTYASSFTSTTTNQPTDVPTQSFGINGLILVNADTDQEIKEISSGDTIDLADYNHEISIIGKAYGPVESVLVFIDGQYSRTENFAPWSIAGDQNYVDVLPWKPTSKNYVIKLEPYSQDSAYGQTVGTGTKGESFSAQISVKDSTPQPDAPSAPTSSIVPTTTLSPKTTNIRPNNLPSPFVNVASKSVTYLSPNGRNLQVPNGFEVNLFATDVSGARWMYYTPSGEILVTSNSGSNIILLKDTNGDGVSDVKKTFGTSSNGLNRPFGMAIHNGYLYIASQNHVRRFSYTNGQQSLSGTGTKLFDIPSFNNYNNHWTRNLVINPAGTKMYVSVGSGRNADVEPLPRASIIEANLDGSNQKTYAYGLRNPTGLGFHPITGELYTSVIERDGLGNNLPPDFFTRVQQGDFYGYPYAYVTPDRKDTRAQPFSDSEAAKTKTADVLIEAHSTPLGFTFYTGDTFPAKYRNGVFVTHHGSWNRKPAAGFKVSFIPFSNNRPTGSYEEFMTGWLVDPDQNSVWGRPTGIIQLPDGSLLVSDNYNNRIYRIQYVG